MNPDSPAAGERLDAKPIIPGLDTRVSALSLGTMVFDWTSTEDHHALLNAFVEHGGTLIDTAPVYGDSEAVIGQWLEGRADRDRIVLLTKCGHGDDLYLPATDFSGVVRDELATSLERLRTDTIDVYVLHRDNQEIPVGAILEPMNAAVESGAVRVIGVSNWEYRRVIEAQAYAEKHGLVGFSVISNTLTLARPQANIYRGQVTVDPVGERWHRETGIPLLPWSSQARGFYAGSYQPSRRDRVDLSEFERDMYRAYGSEENFQRLRRAQTLGEAKGFSAVEIALAWLLDRPFPVLPVVGPRNVDELRSCIRATRLSLTHEEAAWLNLEVHDERHDPPVA